MEEVIKIFKLSECQPDDGERVVLFYENEWSIYCYNAEYNCWDSEDGDDFDHTTEPNDCWFRLPENPKI